MAVVIHVKLVRMSVWNERRPTIYGLTIEAEIGRGGSAVVYRARTLDGRSVALKVLKKDIDVRELERYRQFAAAFHSSSEQKLANARGPEGERFRNYLKMEVQQKHFEREVRMHVALRGKGFVECFDAGIDEQGCPFFVLELMPGGSLSDRLRQLSPKLMPIDEVMRLAASLAETLAHAHALGVVHRDLKPGNILLAASGAPRIADLGLAKHYDRSAPGATHSQEISRSDEVRGTIAYMSPEQATTTSVGPPTDVFSLGVILFECLTGQTPFRGATALEMIARAAQGFYEPPRRLRSDIPKFLSEIVERCLRPDPAERFADGAEVARALALRRIEGETLQFGRETLLRRPSTRAPVRGRSWMLLAITALVALAGAFVVLLTTQSSPTEGALKPSNVTPTPIHGERRPTAGRSPSPAAPAWYLALPAQDRPSHLPRGVKFGSEEGTYINERDGSLMLFIPASVFRMGSDSGPQESRGVHEVELSAFFIGRDEVTYAQFASFVNATGYLTTAEKAYRDESARRTASQYGINLGEKLLKDFTWKRPFGDAPDELPRPSDPVVRVSWIDSAEYAHWAGLELPTEAQWERAAAWDPKSGRSRKYPWGDFDPGPGTPIVANLADETTMLPWKITGYSDGFSHLAPIGSFPAGTSPCGARDMVGNASEWCLDSWDPSYYSHCPRVDPCHRNAQRERVIRGGSWHDGTKLATATCRGWAVEDTGYDDHGIRVVLNPSND